VSRLQGKVALVSGASRGIGEAVVRRFVQEGARVVLADVRDEEGAVLAKEFGDAARYVHTDVTVAGDWTAAVEDTRSAFGGVDVLVNVAGGARSHGPLADEDEADHTWVMQLNVTGTWLGMRAVIPTMAAAGGGSIVNISSIDGLVGVAGMASYAGAKHAVTGLTRSVALETGRQGIRVNSVHPGVIGTPLVLDAGDQVQERLAKALEHQPIHRYGRPDEIAAAVLFFASDDSTYCTGSSLVVDGGHLAGPPRPPT
jgi:3alpha(or 20beta)-hydroxysteroid dehydrogenase